jgi:hypothetical protein
LLAIATAAPAAQRTFVSGHGNDANDCSLDAPCRSFATAITRTDPKGEIVVLDSAGYGRVTIDKSVAIIAPPGIHAGITASGGANGVDIDGAAITVTLRGLSHLRIWRRLRHQHHRGPTRLHRTNLITDSGAGTQLGTFVPATYD